MIDWNAPEIIDRVRRGALAGVGEGIGIVEARAVYLITQTQKSGRLYRKRGVVHRASAPGEPFASRTGDTLTRRDVRVDAGQLRGVLTFRSQKAVWLERGTRHMAPRPFARRALSETRDQVIDAIAGAIFTELQKP